MPSAESLALDEAALWLVRTRDSAFRDWAAFTEWLEGDPEHNRAYETLLDLHDDAGELSRPPPPLPVVMPERPSGLRWIVPLAAGLAATIAVIVQVPRHDRYIVATQAGEQRSVSLDDGTVIALNGATRLTLDRMDQRHVRLDAGEANFTVVHDAARPFIVESGGTVIQDVGTVFNVVRLPGATEVAVAEGEVVYDPGGAALRMTAGRTLYDRDRGVTEVGEADPALIGTWRNGRLSYRDATLLRVASDLSRMIGEPVRLDPALTSRRFSGTIAVRGVEQAQVFARLGALVSVHAARDGHGWLLSPEAGASR